jgi:DNA-binding PadR family transcriptional regulator
MVREFFLGFIKVHILHHAAEGPVYGLALISELRRHGYELSPGKMYPVLHELQQAGYLRRIDRVVSGKFGSTTPSRGVARRRSRMHGKRSESSSGSCWRWMWRRMVRSGETRETSGEDTLTIEPPLRISLRGVA